MNLTENSATSFRFLLPFKNSCQETSRFSREIMSLYLIWQDLQLSLSVENASILSRIKEEYLLWLTILPHIPKYTRFTIGTRIENTFLDLLELSYTTYFSEKEQKSHMLSECISKLDILKYFVSIAWEGKLISHKQYEELATRLDEIGKMFWGWKKSLDNPIKKNRTY